MAEHAKRFAQTTAGPAHAEPLVFVGKFVVELVTIIVVVGHIFIIIKIAVAIVVW
jgi:hypothetical protein